MMAWVGVGWGGMLTFMWRSWCYVDHGVAWVGVGWGGMLTFMWRSWCYVDHGVGWGGMLTFMWRSRCYVDHRVEWGGMLTFMWRWSVEHRPLIQIGNRWSAGFPRKLPIKEALLTWWPTPQNWSKGSGNGCGAEPNCAAIIQRNLQPWANCSMVEVVFRTSKNRRAPPHRQFQWEIHAHALKTTRRLSAPFPRFIKSKNHQNQLLVVVNLRVLQL